MRDKDTILLEEAFAQIEEKFWNRSDAKGGTRMAGLGNKALGGISKLAGGEKTRLGRTAGQLQQQGQMDVEEQRASQLTAIFQQKLEKLYNEFTNDAQKMGFDLNELAQGDLQSKGQGGAYPKMAGLSKFLRGFNTARGAFQGSTPKHTSFKRTRQPQGQV